PGRPSDPAGADGSRRRLPPALGAGAPYDDDGENPLPPALEPEETGPAQPRGREDASPTSMTGDEPSSSRSRPRTRRAASVAPDPGEPSADGGGRSAPGPATRPDGDEPQPIPDEVLPPARRRAPASNPSRDANAASAVGATPRA